MDFNIFSHHSLIPQNKPQGYYSHNECNNPAGISELAESDDNVPRKQTEKADRQYDDSNKCNKYPHS